MHIATIAASVNPSPLPQKTYENDHSIIAYEFLGRKIKGVLAKERQTKGAAMNIIMKSDPDDLYIVVVIDGKIEYTENATPNFEFSVQVDGKIIATGKGRDELDKALGLAREIEIRTQVNVDDLLKLLQTLIELGYNGSLGVSVAQHEVRVAVLSSDPAEIGQWVSADKFIADLEENPEAEENTGILP